MKRAVDWNVRILWLVTLCAGSTLVGCSSGKSKEPEIGDTVTVTGIVTLDGQPLGDAAVKFHPQDAKGYQGATGLTDASGKYELSMILGGEKKKPGVVPGPYKVTVSRWRIKDDKPISEGTGNPMVDGAHETAPFATTSAETTPLAFEVPAAGGTYNIDLTTK